MKGVEAIQRAMRDESRRLAKLQSQKRFICIAASAFLQNRLHEALKKAEAIASELTQYEVGRDHAQKASSTESDRGLSQAGSAGGACRETEVGEESTRSETQQSP